MLPSGESTGSDDIPFRIRVGAVGVQVIEDRDAVAARIDELLSTIIPSLLSPGARRAVEQADRTPVLYGFVGDLGCDAGQLAVQEIRKRPSCPIGKRRADRPAAKVVRYVDQATGRAIVDRSDILIAIWDGNQAAPHNGSIVRVVEHARGRRRPVVSISPFAPYAMAVDEGRVLEADALPAIDELNRVRLRAGERDVAVAAAFEGIFTIVDARTGAKRESDEVAEEAKRTVRDAVLPAYVRAEKVAAQNQWWYRIAGRTVYVLAPISVAAVAMATIVPPLAAVGFATEFVLLVILLAIVISTDRRRARRKWIESRFLAERLRAAIFLTAVGVEARRLPRLALLPDELRAQEWVELAFQEIANQIGPLQLGWGRSWQRSVAFVKRAWIQDQVAYHERTAARAERRNELLEYSAFGIFLAALLAAGIHAYHSLGHESAPGVFHQALTMVAIVFPALGASLGGLRVHREYSRIAKRSRNMRANLEELSRRADEVQGLAELERLLLDTEALMLHEVEDWLLLMSAVRLHAH